MEVVGISKKIYLKTQQMEKLRKILKTLIKQRDGDGKKEGIEYQYEKSLAFSIAQLEDGKPYEIDGVNFNKKPPGTVIGKVAIGLVDQNIANSYKTLQGQIEATKMWMDKIQTEINGLQSILRNLEEV